MSNVSSVHPSPLNPQPRMFSMSPLSGACLIQVHDPPRKVSVTAPTSCFMIKLPPLKDGAIRGEKLNAATLVQQKGAGLFLHFLFLLQYVSFVSASLYLHPFSPLPPPPPPLHTHTHTLWASKLSIT